MLRMLSLDVAVVIFRMLSLDGVVVIFRYCGCYFYACSACMSVQRGASRRPSASKSNKVYYIYNLLVYNLMPIYNIARRYLLL